MEMHFTEGCLFQGGLIQAKEKRAETWEWSAVMFTGSRQRRGVQPCWHMGWPSAGERARQYHLPDAWCHAPPPLSLSLCPYQAAAHPYPIGAWGFVTTLLCFHSRRQAMRHLQVETLGMSRLASGSSQAFWKWSDQIRPQQSLLKLTILSLRHKPKPCIKASSSVLRCLARVKAAKNQIRQR